MILILGVWIYNDIILMPVFRKMFPRLADKDSISKQDGEMKHGEDFETSYGSPTPTESPNAGKTEQSTATRDISNSVIGVADDRCISETVSSTL